MRGDETQGEKPHPQGPGEDEGRCQIKTHSGFPSNLARTCISVHLVELSIWHINKIFGNLVNGARPEGSMSGPAGQLSGAPCGPWQR
jgi:hypothetical protein